jgi:pyridoxal phosphate enzyme (YggS family)
MKFYTNEIKKQVPNNVTIVAATKYFNADEMRELYQTGITHFGENRVEALLEKQTLLMDVPITWHYIGTLQTKKVKKVINTISYLHSLNTIKLADEINKRRTLPLKCFLQVNISDEESKHGFDCDEVIEAITYLKNLPNIELIGLMGMAEYTDNDQVIHQAFQKLNDLQKQIKEELNLNLTELSIGMSNDYLIALEHNATFLRLGSVLFKKEAN